MGINPASSLLEVILCFSTAARRAAAAATQAETFTSVLNALEPAGLTGLIFEGGGTELQLACASGLSKRKPLPERLPVDLQSLEPLFSGEVPLLLPVTGDAPSGSAAALEHLDNLRAQSGCRAAACLPLRGMAGLRAVLVLGSTQPALEPAVLQCAADLAVVISSALQKQEITREKESAVSGLEILDMISAALSGEISLEGLFHIIHELVNQAMGEVNLYIALYHEDSGLVEIPYMTEDGERLQVDPFPLGEGLTSIIIRTRQPLRLVENVRERALALGAKVAGKTPRSWLGVPLLSAGRAFGAMVIQDMEREQRFTLEDQQLLVRIAGPAANAVRSAYLLDAVRRQTERERQLYAISSKIRRSTDMESILRTTASELGHALGLRRAHIELQFPAEAAAQNDQESSR